MAHISGSRFKKENLLMETISNSAIESGKSVFIRSVTWLSLV